MKKNEIKGWGNAGFVGRRLKNSDQLICLVLVVCIQQVSGNRMIGDEKLEYWIGMVLGLHGCFAEV